MKKVETNPEQTADPQQEGSGDKPLNQPRPETKEINGPNGPEPTRFGDWERKGRYVDF